MSPARTLVVVPIVVLFSVVDRLAGGAIIEDLAWGVGVTVAVAALIAVPSAVWLLERGTTGLAPFIGLGGATGALPLVGALLSGMVGRLARGGTSWLFEFMAYAAPIPLIGAIPWPTFATWVFRGVLTGAASGVVFWALAARRRRAAP